MKDSRFSLKVFLLRTIPNLSIVAGLLILVLLVIDKFNTIMNFINNDITKGIIFVFIILSVISSVICMVYERKLYASEKALRKVKEEYKILLKHHGKKKMTVTKDSAEHPEKSEASGSVYRINKK